MGYEPRARNGPPKRLKMRRRRVVYGVPGAETSTGFNDLIFGRYCVKHRRAREAVSTIMEQRLEVSNRCYGERNKGDYDSTSPRMRTKACSPARQRGVACQIRSPARETGDSRPTSAARFTGSQHGETASPAFRYAARGATLPPARAGSSTPLSRARRCIT